MDRDIEAAVITATSYVAMLGMIAVLFGQMTLGLLMIAGGSAVHLSGKASALIAFLIYGLLHKLG